MRALVYLVYLLLKPFGWLPLPVVHALGATVGELAWLLHPRSVRIARINLRQARPQWSEAGLKSEVRRVMHENGRSALEIAHVWGAGAQRALHLVREVKGREVLEQALADGRGVIIAAPHLGCWELLNHWLCSRTRMAILYRPPRIAALEWLLRKVRGDLAPEQIRAEGAGVRTLYRRLKEGGTVGILPDQKPRRGDGQFAPFYGRDALTMVLLPRLAARTGATVLFAFAERLPDGLGYRIHIRRAGDGLADPDLQVACTALNREVEACVERAFHQYQWTYKRYTPPPPGQDNPYRG